MYDLIILGAGAAGLMAAASLPRHRVLLIDHNPKPAVKIEISGGGYCNITHERLDESFYLGDPSFVRTVLNTFDNRQLLAWLKKRGLTPVKRPGGQWFCRHSAKELSTLLRESADHADWALGHEIMELFQTPRGFGVRTDRGEWHGRRVLVATGGLSYPKIGASGIGFEIARAFGHEVVAPRPALVGLTLQKEQAWMKTLAGISVPVEVAVGRRRLAGSLLFAHKGVSGPAVLDASLYWNGGKITVDFLPGVRLKSVLKSRTKSIASLLPLPRRLTRAFLEAQAISNLPYAQLSEAQKERLSYLKSYAFAPAGTFGYTKAEVTKGGVATEGIDPRTMQSRLVEGLFFAGEVVDVTGRVGGYNFQWAFASAVTAASAVANVSR